MQVVSSVNKPNRFSPKVARRIKQKIKLAMTGPSGAGKTLSSLMIARGLCADWSKIALADTESSSALCYGEDVTGPWMHIDFPSTISGGHSPENFVELIRYVEEETDAEVLIIDSFSHAYNGENGLLEVVDKSSARGNSFSGWKVATPMQRKMMEVIRRSRLHIIATMRAITAWEIETNDKGKKVPVKLGTKPQQREGVEYEFDLVFELDQEHNATSSKDRTQLFDGKGSFKASEMTGKMLAEWSNKGLDEDDIIYDGTPAQSKKLGAILRESGVDTNADKEKAMAYHKKMLELKVRMGDLRARVEELQLSERREADEQINAERLAAEEG